MPEKLYAPATIMRRFLNFIIDRATIVIITIIVLLIVDGADGNLDGTSLNGASSIWISLLPIIVYILYFIVFEAIWQRSLGKLATSTKVVMRDGSKPSFINVLGRSFARIIPFEQFSFLISAYPIGWHDALSKTLVVPSDYNADDVKKIDLQTIKKVKGDSAIILVVVIIVSVLMTIAVIGFFSAIVLVSLNSARQKGHDAYISSALNSIQIKAEYYKNSFGDYSVAKSCSDGMFARQDITEIVSILRSYENSSVLCYAEEATYAVSARMVSSDKTVCIDKAGFNPIGIASDTDKIASCQLNQPSLGSQEALFARTTKTYSDRRYLFSIEYPATWETYAETTGRPYSIFFIGPDSPLSAGLRGSVAVNITENDAPTDLSVLSSQFEQQIKDQAEAQGNQWKVLSKKSDVFLGLPALQYVTTKLRTFDNGKTYVKQESKIIFFTKGNLVYDIEYKNDIDNFDRMLSIGEQIISTLKIN